MEASTWPLVLQLAAGAVGGFGGALINHFLTLRRETTLKDAERAREARYVAIRVVCALDNLASSCIDLAHDSGSPDDQGCFYPDVPAPTFVIPTDVDWRAIEPDLMYRTLALPNQLDSARRQIAAVSDYVAGPPDFQEFFWERVIEYGEVGLKVLSLTNDYRSRYEIPANDRYGYDVRAVLSSRIQEAQLQKTEANVRRDEMFDRLNELK